MVSFSDIVSNVGALLRQRTLGRSIVLLLSVAILLLLIVNATTFVMIQRTAAFNDQVEAAWQARRSGRLLLLNLKDAETAQRGYVLTGLYSFRMEYDRAVQANAYLIDTLAERLGNDPVDVATVESVTRLSRDKILEMSAVIGLSEGGQGQQATRRIAQGDGKALMEQLESELGDLDRRMGTRLAERRAQSEGSAAFTAVVNGLAGLLILLLGVVVFLLVRRYLAELKDAQAAIDRVNAGLEETVKARTAALLRSNEEVQRFAYIVSHDLRSPLVNVMGYTAELEQAGRTIDLQMTRVETVAPELLERDALTAAREDIPEAVGFIRASTEKMDRLINAILKLSREGRRNLVPETLDVGDLTARIADTVRHQLEATETEVVVGEMVPIESDRLSMEQILGNLIDNAVKYLQPGRPGRIEVTGRDLPGGWVEYAIADNGRGIAEKDHERVFELFRRAGRQDQKGEGLGLAFVRNSVRRLGGDVRVESVPGEGSTFRLKFPKRLILDAAGDAL
ncbi:sensor histidine kinase [Brevundimonas subvibrioides]|uniref:sensor histidine kinase n=1 Tax=Brevundimonas subvibrioides TaxID=74313 RepID=UPI0022B53B4F|nr:ATP-binding protein [Brevundimonas subvibrioides]